MTSQATRLLDAQTVLVGWINHSATDCYEHSRSSGDVVNLGTDLEASSSFVLVASHPGHSEAVTVTLELAPLLADGTAGSWITAAALRLHTAKPTYQSTRVRNTGASCTSPKLAARWRQSSAALPC
jgi:hypothetical protein